MALTERFKLAGCHQRLFVQHGISWIALIMLAGFLHQSTTKFVCFGLLVLLFVSTTILRFLDNKRSKKITFVLQTLHDPVLATLTISPVLVITHYYSALTWYYDHTLKYTRNNTLEANSTRMVGAAAVTDVISNVFSNCLYAPETAIKILQVSLMIPAIFHAINPTKYASFNGHLISSLYWAVQTLELFILLCKAMICMEARDAIFVVILLSLFVTIFANSLLIEGIFYYFITSPPAYSQGNANRRPKLPETTTEPTESCTVFGERPKTPETKGHKTEDYTVEKTRLSETPVGQKENPTVISGSARPLATRVESNGTVVVALPRPSDIKVKRTENCIDVIDSPPCYKGLLTFDPRHTPSSNSPTPDEDAVAENDTKYVKFKILLGSLFTEIPMFVTCLLIWKECPPQPFLTLEILMLKSSLFLAIGIVYCVISCKK